MKRGRSWVTRYAGRRRTKTRFMMLFEQTATHHLALIKLGLVEEGKNILESQAFEEMRPLKFDEIYPRESITF